MECKYKKHIYLRLKKNPTKSEIMMLNFEYNFWYTLKIDEIRFRKKLPQFGCF